MAIRNPQTRAIYALARNEVKQFARQLGEKVKADFEKNRPGKDD